MENQTKLTQNLAVELPVSHWIFNAAKRLVDVIASAIGLLLLFPFFLVIAIAIKLEDPGPVFYRGHRIGKGGREFGILKFRTMYENPHSYSGPRVTAQNDGRITPIGKWLRDTKLNELPQLWNVLIGEMSLVGPRPEDPEIVRTWPSDAQAEILSVRPGLTSPASVLYRNEESLLSTDNVMEVYLREILPDKLRLDRLYVRNHSFFGDLDAVFWTLMALIPNAAMQRVPESRLFAGPLYRFVRRHLSWFVADLLVSLAAVVGVGVTWRLFATIDWGLQALTFLALFLAVLFSSVNLFLGLDRIIWSRANAEDAIVLAVSTSLSVLLIMGLNYGQGRWHWLPFPPLPMEFLVLTGFATLAGNLMIRYRLRLVTSFAARWLSWRKEGSGFGERILIVGAGEGGQIANWLLRRGILQRAISVVGMVDDDPAKQGMCIDRCWVIGGSGDIPALVKKHDVGIIVFAITNLSESVRNNLVKLCTMPGIRLVFLSEIISSVQRKLI